MIKENIINISLNLLTIIIILFTVVISKNSFHFEINSFLKLFIIFGFYSISHIVLLFITLFVKNNQNFNKKRLLINYIIYESSFYLTLIILLIMKNY